MAGASGPRPEGIADGPAGHGAGPYPVTDRASRPAAPLSPAGRELHDRFVAAIDDDLDMPVALALMRRILRADLPADERRWLLLDADAVLGLDLHAVWDGPGRTSDGEVPADVTRLLAERAAARDAHDYARGDALRAELATAGWDVIDSADGSRVQRRPGR